MSEEINIYAYLASMCAVVVLIGLLAGIYAKFVSVVIGTLAYPTYLSIYGMEFILAPGKKKERKFFGFNLPKSGNARYACHFLGMTVTLLLLAPLGWEFFESLTSQEKQIRFIVSAMYGRILPPVVLLVPLACLVAMYVISWHTEIDSNSPMEKIEALSVPSLWKKAIGG